MIGRRGRLVGIGAALVLAVGAGWALLRLGRHLELVAEPHSELRLAVSAALAIAALVVPAAFVVRRRAARLASLLLLLALGGAMLWDEADHHLEHLGSPQQLRTWNVFHYYLGSKYFDELGYRGLYREALKADYGGLRHFMDVERVRSMETYEFVSADPIRREPVEPVWSGARWREFSEDVASIGTRRSRWEGPFSDRGYNPSPVWTAVGSFFTSHLSIREVDHQVLLALLDPLLLLAAFALSVHAYGLARSLLVLAGIAGWYGNQGVLFGGIYQLDWLAASWAALSAVRLGNPGMAGVLVGYAAAVRLFPAAFLAGPAFAAAWHLGKTRRLPVRALWLGGAAVLSFVALAVVAALLFERGFGVYSDFLANLQVHTQTHVLGQRRVGLEHLFLLDWAGGLPGGLSRGDHGETLAANHHALRLVQLVFVAAVGVAARRRNLHDAMLLGLPLFFALAVSSRYYACAHALVLLFAAPARRAGAAHRARPLGLGAFDAAFFVVVAAVYGVEASGRMQTYLFGNALLALFWGTWLVARVAEGPEARREPAEPAGARLAAAPC